VRSEKNAESRLDQKGDPFFRFCWFENCLLSLQNSFR
jgi:hypothetical protein